jgi:hypothetical protein
MKVAGLDGVDEKGRHVRSVRFIGVSFDAGLACSRKPMHVRDDVGNRSIEDSIDEAIVDDMKK